MACLVSPPPGSAWLGILLSRWQNYKRFALDTCQPWPLEIEDNHFADDVVVSQVRRRNVWRICKGGSYHNMSNVIGVSFVWSTIGSS